MKDRNLYVVATVSLEACRDAASRLYAREGTKTILHMHSHSTECVDAQHEVIPACTCPERCAEHPFNVISSATLNGETII